MNDENMALWSEVSKTSTKYIKGGQKGLSSIDSYYMFQQATKAFGICGIGWGYEILEEEYREGVDIVNKNKDSAKYSVGQVLGKETNHIVKIKLWFKVDGQTGSVVNYGVTPAVYGSKWGVTTDEEAPKKSLTDAIKKCLSMLGFSADVYMGKFEDSDYRQGAEIRTQIEESDDADKEQIRAIHEFEQWLDNEITAAQKVRSEQAFINTMQAIYKKSQTKCQAIGINPTDHLAKITNLVDERKEQAKEQQQHES